MKEIKQEKVEQIIKEKINTYEVIYCDLCNKKIDEYELYDYHSGRMIEYNELSCEVAKPIMGMLLESHNWGDSGDMSGETYDICKDCYINKIKPLLKKELGLEPRIVDYDW